MSPEIDSEAPDKPVPIWGWLVIILSLPCGAVTGLALGGLLEPILERWGFVAGVVLGAVVNPWIAYHSLRSGGRVELLAWLVIGPVVGVFIGMPILRRTGGRGGQLTACKSNEKNIATALEMYSQDNGGRYPAGLASLTPNYLKTIPQCPEAMTRIRAASWPWHPPLPNCDTYSASYHSSTGPDAYTVVCQGMWHTSAGVNVPNYPQYSSYAGLILP